MCRPIICDRSPIFWRNLNLNSFLIPKNYEISNLKENYEISNLKENYETSNKVPLLQMEKKLMDFLRRKALSGYFQINIENYLFEMWFLQAYKYKTLDWRWMHFLRPRRVLRHII